jgi:methionyl-tRNA formyltransferase
VDVVLVATHTDHPGEKLWFQRVADTANELGLPWIYADDPKSPELAAAVSAARPDVIFSFYYRAMIPTAVLALAPQGAFNMHGSLLPHFRGRAPTNWAVLMGATETGATLHEMVAKADAGAIIDQGAVPILPDDTAEQVFNKVTVAAEQVLWRCLPALIRGDAKRLLNPIELGSYFGGRKPEDGRIDWQQAAAQVYNLIRAVAPPYPGAFTEVAGQRLVVARARRAGMASHDGAANAAGKRQDLTPGLPGLPQGRTPGLYVVDTNIYALCGDGQAIHIHQLLCNGRDMDATALRALLSKSAEKVSP